MLLLERVLEAADSVQRRHDAVAVPVAVALKYREDSGGDLAALLTYYGFLAVFPLLLTGVTLLGLVLRSHPALQARLLGTALSEFPVVGEQLRVNVHSLPGSGGALVGLAVALVGARGAGNALQTAANRVWDVPAAERPSGVSAQLRSMFLLVLVGCGVLATAIGTGVASSLGLGPLSAVGVAAMSTVVDVGLLVAALRVATAPVVPTRDLLAGAVVGAVGLALLQQVGNFLVLHELRHAGEVYGSFAVVLGLIAWLYAQAVVTVVAMETSVVLARRTWPRGLRSRAPAG